MSELIHLAEELQEIHAEIRLTEEHFRRSPDSLALRHSYDSLFRRQAELEELFHQVAADDQVDICSYRFIAPENRAFTLSGISKILGDFQELVTIMYDGVRRRKITPKHRATVGKAAADESALNFGYTFAGSLGFVFTIRNEVLIGIQSKLDDAIEKTFELMRIRDTEKLHQFVETYGSASVRKAYEWAEDSAESRYAADVRWQRAGEDRAALLVQQSEFTEFIRLIDRVGKEISEPIQSAGILVGADLKSRTFHALLDAGGEIRGKFGRRLVVPAEIQLNRRYVFDVLKTTVVKPSDDREGQRYELRKLEFD